MHTDLIIDEKLLSEAMELGQIRNKKAAVEASLRLFIQMKKQEQLRALRGKLVWDGNLDEMRLD